MQRFRYPPAVAAAVSGVHEDFCPMPGHDRRNGEEHSENALNAHAEQMMLLV